MASGKTLELRALNAQFSYRTQTPWQQKPRDRSLRGKARIRARKAQRREALLDDS